LLFLRKTVNVFDGIQRDKKLVEKIKQWIQKLDGHEEMEHFVEEEGVQDEFPIYSTDQFEFDIKILKKVGRINSFSSNLAF
jgi:hypothetical protein